MSRIGNKPIVVPESVQVSNTNGLVVVKGPKGELKQQVDPGINVKQEGNELLVTRATEQKRHKSMHGLYRSLINNMVEGVEKGFSTELELVGVGFRAAVTGNKIDFSLGYSHNILFVLPEEVKADVTADKGKNPILKLESFDKQLLGQIVAKVRELRKVEPYKGKGIRFKGEQIRRKAGKAAAK